MKLTKISLALAALAAVAGGSALAGQIDSSSTTLAREVIYANSQVLRAPSKSYDFIGNVDARTNEQRLQLQWALNKGGALSALKWSRLGDVALTTNPIALAATQTVLQVSYNDGANAPTNVFPAGTVVEAFLADGDQTLVFNVTIPAGAGLDPFLLKAPQFRINASDFAGAAQANVGVTNAFEVAKAVACLAPDTTANINFRHFTNHFGNNTLLDGTVATFPDSEHLRSGSTNDGRLLSFTENLRFNFVTGVQSQTDAATLRTTFIRTAVDTTAYAAAVATLGVPATRLHRISNNIDLRKVANGLDLDYLGQYGLPSATPDFLAADFVNAPTATLNDNTIETEALGMVFEVRAPVGNVAVGATVALLDNADAAIPGVAVTAFAVDPLDVTKAVARVTLSSDAGYAAFTTLAGSRLYYVVNGTATVPQNGVFDVTATLDKGNLGTVREQDNICKAPQAGIGGGIKIDVRNYASAATFGPTGPKSIVRIINNSESQPADVFGQIIYADGKYGPWGSLVTGALAPRAVLQLSNAQIEALLTNAAATTNPFGTGTVYTNETGAATVASPGGIGDRLRIVSNTGTTLRVQSYMLLNGEILDTSPAQGVDFENTANNRTPTTAIDAQPVSQDAINGLGRN
jgi:hypothetical protein